MSAQRRVLEINDLAVTVAEPGRVLARSPGQIVCGSGRAGDRMLIGPKAAGQRRINPRAMHDRFWTWLDDAPLARPAGPARSHADLAWFHLRDLLEQIDNDGRWLIAVPSQYDDEKLALFLGIARSLEMDIEAMTYAAAAAAAAQTPSPGEVLAVVDCGWHRFTVDRVAHVDGSARLDGVEPGRERGLGALHDAWAGLLIDEFVTQTRFDPSRDAVVEQTLYDRLPEWLEPVERGETLVAELDPDPDGGRHRYRVELDPERFVAAAEPFYRDVFERVRQTGARRVVLRHRVAALPGFRDLFTGSPDFSVSVIDELGFFESLRRRGGAAVRAVRQGEGAGNQRADGESDHRGENRLAGRSALFFDGLPADDGDPAPGSATPAPEDGRPGDRPGDRPSHVLVEGRAIAIGAEGVGLPGGAGSCRIVVRNDGGVELLVDKDVEAWINDRPVTGSAAVSAGDRIRIGSREFVPIRVEDSGTRDRPGAGDGEGEST